jgi:hypothetical protein
MSLKDTREAVIKTRVYRDRPKIPDTATKNSAIRQGHAIAHIKNDTETESGKKKQGITGSLRRTTANISVKARF